MSASSHLKRSDFIIGLSCTFKWVFIYVNKGAEKRGSKIGAEEFQSMVELLDQGKKLWKNNQQ